MGRASASKSACGIRIAASSSPAAGEAVSEARRGLGGEEFQHIVAFFSIEYDADELCRELTAAFPTTPVTGCSTAGEIAPAGMMEGGLVLIAFPNDGFRVHTGVINDIDASGVERASEIVAKLKTKLPFPAGHKLADRVFGVMLVDGLSNAEEAVIAAVHWAFDDMQLIGGSSGDGLSFKRTSLIHEGRVMDRAAILIIIESDFQFRIFKTQNIDPTPIKLVVTAADASRRVVHELNAEPAAREYASAIGLMPDDLGPFSFASYPLVVKVGGDYYCRSIRNMNEDGSLSFFCAIDEGIVFTVARAQDILASTETTLSEVERSLGGVDVVLGFDCILRRLDAESRQIRLQMEDLYRRYRIVGFHTYGEQFNAMHLNQTLTGVAFGVREAAK